MLCGVCFYDNSVFMRILRELDFVVFVADTPVTIANTAADA